MPTAALHLLAFTYETMNNKSNATPVQRKMKISNGAPSFSTDRFI